MRIPLALGVSLCAMGAAPAFVHADDRVPLHIRSAHNTEGFSDPDKHRRDSVKDLIDKLDESKAVKIVNTESDAWVLLEVLDRETKRETNLFGRQNKSYVTVRLTAGSYSTEFVGESKSKGVLTGYGNAAKQIAKQVDEWVTTNRDKLVAQQTERAAGAGVAPEAAPTPQP